MKRAPPKPTPGTGYIKRVGDDSWSLWSRVYWTPDCGETLECGGECVLARGHVVPCECAGDDPGVPGSCPA